MANIVREPPKRPEWLSHWQRLLDFVRRHQPPQWVFRGQARHWSLRPSAGRMAQQYQPSRELQLFNEFKRLGQPMFPNAMLMDDWDWLFVGQHHGLPTRLLDWTTNPLVAAYFACQPDGQGRCDGEIIAVRVSDIGLLSTTDRPRSPFMIERPTFVYPSAVAPRISSQRGLFSIHPEPAKRWILRNKTDRFSVKGANKERFLGYLYGLGVDAAMVMADADGLARNLKWRYTSERSIL
jgi:FRG domain